MPSRRCLTTGTVLALAASVAQAQLGNYSTISNVSSSACPSEGGAHIIVARASTEPLGYGIIGAVKDLVLEAVPASNAEYVVYPATLTDYFNSESDGVLGMKELVEAYVAQDCPNNAPLVLMGYSQGAQVVADYVSGQNVGVFPYNSSLAEPAPDNVLSKIAAIITMGDPSINITNNPAHVGNSTKPGLFERFGNATSIFETSGLDNRTQAYCNALDPYCASAGNFDNITVHLVYVQEFGMQARDFVVQKIEEWYGSSTGTSNGTANGTSNGTTSEGGTMSGASAPSPSDSAASSIRDMQASITAALLVTIGFAFAYAL
ncbi:Acetylxylan esterase [Cercospora beticola]|uniref:Acetylxylan esterase n=1 Tax=Cercospora beticola TaxID=122368 RepID=A0A2G5HNT4_CERBT|nr:Acetylxylan esterase [Cercospora beticola]PIA94178.1 Acetylxylan esterase [Cercospora beticola]WPB04599.1 hypothetical protein RHO25_009245 [Cercospora beticola]CAK1364345.1 unnamed protein product [Cercospora beticola]